MKSKVFSPPYSAFIKTVTYRGKNQIKQYFTEYKICYNAKETKEKLKRRHF